MSDPAPEVSMTRESGAPFNAPDADIVLRTIDGVDFRTYKSYLTRTLHGLDDLLNAGHMNGIGGVEEQQNGVLVIPLPETSAVLELFLRSLYPAEFGCPALSNHLSLMTGVCKALNKYCVKNFPLAVSDALMLAAEKEPEYVYAISCRYAALSEAMKVAAKNTLRKTRRLDNLPDNVIAEISSLQYHALGKYQIACRAAASGACEVAAMGSMPSETPGARSRNPGCAEEFHRECKCDVYWHSVEMDELYGPPDDPDFEHHECRIPEWLGKYMGSVRDHVLISDRISGELALEGRHLSPAIVASKECPSCGSEAGMDEFIRYAHRLAKWIQGAIDCIVFQTSGLAA
ncbi:unnamed protein product [Peniophora sp. CBMAI 1063]|nr:unnamed protein product [Peniophora sp. CBMAI 1063]